MTAEQFLEGTPMIFRNEAETLTTQQMVIRRQVYEAITANGGKQFNMGTWEDEGCGDPDCALCGTRRSCDTVRCVGGWAQFFLLGRVNTDTVEQDAITAMGLTEAEYTVQGVAYRDVGLFYAPDEAAVERMRVLAGVE